MRYSARVVPICAVVPSHSAIEQGACAALDWNSVTATVTCSMVSDGCGPEMANPYSSRPGEVSGDAVVTEGVVMDEATASALPMVTVADRASLTSSW